MKPLLDRHHSMLLDAVIKTFDIQAEMRFERTHSGPKNEPTAESVCITLPIEGGLSGQIALAAEPPTIAHMANQILNKAFGGDFDPAMADADLQANTIGEMLNFLLGDFVAQMQNKSSSMIKVPLRVAYRDFVDGLPADAANIALVCDGHALRAIYTFQLADDA